VIAAARAAASSPDCAVPPVIRRPSLATLHASAERRTHNTNLPENLMHRLLFALLVSLASTAFAQSPTKIGTLTLTDPWARASAGGQTSGAAYLSITNDGATDRILSAAAPVANVIELHTHTVEGGVMRMRQVDAIDVTGGTTTQLKPGGLHIMLIGLKAPLKDGDSFPLTLKFEKAGEVKLDVKVRTAPAGGPMKGHGHRHDHK
jgi:periplasmic copper chaperone A